MERYLVYDSACSVCSHLAREIEALAGAKLSAVSIHDDAAKALLDQAYPDGWQHAPYLLRVQDGRVRAATGLAAITRLGLLLGPRKAHRAWALAKRSGVSVVGLAAAQGTSVTRRYALKLIAALTGAMALRGAIPQVGHAEDCDYVQCGFIVDTFFLGCGQHCGDCFCDRLYYNEWYMPCDSGPQICWSGYTCYDHFGCGGQYCCS